MSRARSKEISSPLSLFPFIGVLLSTMGALLVVLIAVSRSARDAALRDVADKQQSAAAAQLALSDAERQELEELAAVSKQAESLRAEAEAKLRNDQLRLSHLEEQLRSLKDQVDKLRVADFELRAMDEAHLDDRRQAERELKRLHELIAESRERIRSQKEELAAKKKSFAIIPYEGPYGTKRRPLYIECQKDWVVLQPEGIKLAASDFAPPIDSGNPLAAALRAAREHIVPSTNSVVPTKQMEPYPLILVRPDGVESYYAVRRAIESWDSDFGYEFVGADWKLEFPPADPQLAKLEHQAIEQARDHREAMAAAAPRAYGPARVMGSYGSGFGGNSPVRPPMRGGGGRRVGATAAGGPSGGEKQAEKGAPQQTYAGLNFAGPTRPGAARQSGDSSSPSVFGGMGSSEQPGSPQTKGNADGERPSNASGAAPAGGKVAESASGNRSVESGSRGGATYSTENRSLAAASANHRGPKNASSGSAQDGTSAGSGGPAGAEGADAGQAGGGPSGGEPSGAGVPGGPVPAGMAGNAGLSAVPTGATAANAGGNLGSGMGSNLSSLPPSRVHEAATAITPQELAGTRGNNWALSPTGGNVPVRRSIRVVVRQDRIAILPDNVDGNDLSGGTEIEFSPQMIDRIDVIVAAIQQHVREWGIAGNGLYWRPVLVMHVGPEAEPRVNELTALLKNSGIELRTTTAQQPRDGNEKGLRQTR
jgi:hypothetical protein